MEDVEKFGIFEYILFELELNMVDKGWGVLEFVILCWMLMIKEVI